MLSLKHCLLTTVSFLEILFVFSQADQYSSSLLQETMGRLMDKGRCGGSYGGTGL